MRAVVLVAALTGCGSGEDPFGTADWDDAWIALEDGVLERVNEERAAGGSCAEESFPASEPLVSDDLLRGLARDFSRRMAEEEFFDHVDPNGDDPFDRLAAAGFAGDTPWGENLAAGFPTAEDVVAGWMESPGHCANILQPAFGAIGVGYYLREDDPTKAKHFWTQEFAGSPQP